jgi:hypothetical protein
MNSGFRVLLACVFLGGCAASRTTPIDEPSTLEGLQRVRVDGIDAVYRRPDANFSQYRRLLIRDVDIAFTRGWEQQQNSATRSWTQEDSDRIRHDLRELFTEVAKRELQSRGGYELVNQPGPDVLEIRPSIIDLYIAAPDTSRTDTGIVRRYTTDAGRMTLIAELRDSMSSEVLARAFDKKEAMHTQQWEWTTSVTNSQKARIAIESWASTLREALDGARGKGPAAASS